MVEWQDVQRRIDAGEDRHTEYILTEERAVLDAPPTHIDLEAFRFYLRRLGFDTMDDPQPDSVDDLRNRDVLVEIGGELRATLYGILAFGEIPNATRGRVTFGMCGLHGE